MSDTKNSENELEEFFAKKREELKTQMSFVNMPSFLEFLESEFILLQKIDGFVHAKLGNDNGQKIGMYVKILYDSAKNHIAQQGKN